MSGLDYPDIITTQLRGWSMLVTVHLKHSKRLCFGLYVPPLLEKSKIQSLSFLSNDLLESLHRLRELLALELPSAFLRRDLDVRLVYHCETSI